MARLPVGVVTVRLSLGVVALDPGAEEATRSLVLGRRITELVDLLSPALLIELVDEAGLGPAEPIDDLGLGLGETRGVDGLEDEAGFLGFEGPFFRTLDREVPGGCEEFLSVLLESDTVRLYCEVVFGVFLLSSLKLLELRAGFLYCML